MARVKIAYIGGGSTRAPGTVASFIRQWRNFAGSEIALMDLDEEKLKLVRDLARRMIEAEGADLTVSATLDRREALDGCDGVLSSYRPGGFEARYQDEIIPLRLGAVGQETQGAGGLFMALRAIHVAQGLVRDMEELCPQATLFNYTNPVNIVAQAVADHSPVRVISLCEGPVVFPREIAEVAGLDPEPVRAVMLGLNHACWSAQAEYGGRPFLPLLAERLAVPPEEGGVQDPWARRWLELAVAMDSLPASYMKYYFFEDEMRRELQAKSTTRAQDILREVPSYWAHYAEQRREEKPELRPELSRGGIFELEIAVDVMDSFFNDKNEVWPTNVVGRGSVADFADDVVVEVPCVVGRDGARPIAGHRLPPGPRALVGALAEYQQLAARAAWSGTRKDAVQALVSNPLVRQLPLAEALYAELAHAHRAHLPERLW